MTTSESKGRFFLQKESIRIDSHNESNRIYSNRELECSTGCTCIASGRIVDGPHMAYTLSFTDFAAG